MAERRMSDWARFYTEKLGLALVPIMPGTKAPMGEGWNEPGGYYDNPEKAAHFWEEHPGYGMGMVLGPSRKATLDVDDMEGARKALGAVGLDLDSFLTGCQVQGNPQRAKPVYSVPEGVTLERRALSWPAKEPGGKPVMVFELRGGAVQDVLPPTIHPGVRRPYRWVHAPWKNGGVPQLPVELLDLWQRWDELHDAMVAACPWKLEEPKKSNTKSSRERHATSAGAAQWDAIRDEVLRRMPLDAMLSRAGIEKRGKRYLCPFHPEKQPSFWTFDTGRGYEKWSDAHGVAPVGKPTSKGFFVGDSIDLYQHVEGLSSRGKAIAGLAKELGIALPETERSRPAKGSGKGKAKNSRRVEPAESTLHDDFDPRYIAPGVYALTDLGNAYRLVQRHKERLRYCHEAERWLVWDGKRWSPDLQEQAVQLAKDTACSVYLEASHVRDSLDLQAEIAKHARASQKGSRIREMLTLARSEPPLPVGINDMDRNLWLLNVENGTVDLRTGELLPHRREDNISKLAPAVYDPHADCPMWLSFLARIMGMDSDPGRAERLIGFLQRAVGYSLTGTTGEHCLFFLYGTGRNGKGTFVETIRSCLGEYAQNAEFGTFIEKKSEAVRNDLARLVGSRFVSASEAKQGSRFDEGLIKGLTGEDPITARFLRKEYFEYLPAFKIWLAANHKPIIRGTDEGIWSRIHLIPFTEQIPAAQRDKNLKTKLRKELAGILRWAIEGCLEWQRNGLGAPDEVKQATADYRDEMDILAGFIEDCCILSGTAECATNKLHAEYVRWCDANGETAYSMKVMGPLLTARGMQRVRLGKNREKGWRGIGLRSDRQPAADPWTHADPRSGVVPREGQYRESMSFLGSARVRQEQEKEQTFVFAGDLEADPWSDEGSAADPWKGPLEREPGEEG